VFKRDAPASLATVLAQSPALRDKQRMGWSTWRNIVGHRVATHTMPLRVENETLHVVVSSALWASELSLLQTPILVKLRTVLPQVSLLRFRVGHVEIPKDTAPPARVRQAALPEELAKKAEAIADEGLRRALVEAARYSLGRDETKTLGTKGRA
jgi:hypothetical protein